MTFPSNVLIFTNEWVMYLRESVFACGLPEQLPDRRKSKPVRSIYDFRIAGWWFICFSFLKRVRKK
jgi:hypothetical protein